jgi:putative ABC transport system ATP-binding protein
MIIPFGRLVVVGLRGAVPDWNIISGPTAPGLQTAHRTPAPDVRDRSVPKPFHSKKEPVAVTVMTPIKPAAEAVITLDRVHITLGSGASRVHILKGLSLGIGGGESVGIVGPSGSGKSTLLMIMAGLERIDQGSVAIAGTKLDGMSEDEIAAFRGRTVGIVFQSFHLIPNMTALENVAVPLELAGDPDAFAKAERELTAVGLGGRLTHYPSELSGGEQQRVAIARALAPSPAILIADEPTGNLDTATGRQIADLLFAQQAERGMTLVLVTHDRDLAARCGRQIAIRAGELDLTDAEAGAAAI